MIRPVSAVILAGGRGTRAVATGDRTPKVLRRLKTGETLLANVTRRALSVTAQVIVAVGPMRTLLESACPPDDRIGIVEDAGYGTYAALISASLVASFQHVLVMNADTINDMPYGPFVDFHLRRAVGASILLSRWAQAQNPATYAVDGKGRVVCSFEDRRTSQPYVPHDCWRGASTGVLMFSNPALRSLSMMKSAVIERDLTPKYIDHGLMWAFDSGEALTLDLGVPDRIARIGCLSRSALWRRD